METIINVYHVENAAFEKGDIEYGEPEEVVVVFATSPSFTELVECPNGVELYGRD
jgi:hypothetical protein